MTIQNEVVLAIPPRPDRDEPGILQEALDGVLESILVELGARDGEADSVRDQVLSAMRDCCGDYDGYQLAKILDRDCLWDPHAGLVDTLDRIGSHVLQVHRKRVEEWVKAHGVRPTFKVGERVEFKSGWGTKRGLVVGVRELDATYVVQEDGRGYSGSRPEFPLGLLVNYEDASPFGAGLAS